MAKSYIVSVRSYHKLDLNIKNFPNYVILNSENTHKELNRYYYCGTIIKIDFVLDDKEDILTIKVYKRNKIISTVNFDLFKINKCYKMTDLLGADFDFNQVFIFGEYTDEVKKRIDYAQNVKKDTREDIRKDKEKDLSQILKMTKKRKLCEMIEDLLKD